MSRWFAVRSPLGHFDIYTGAPFERVSADQIAFLHRVARLPSTSARPEA